MFHQGALAAHSSRILIFSSNADPICTLQRSAIPTSQKQGPHGGTLIVMFSTTYSESAYPSNCDICELFMRTAGKIRSA